MLFSATLDRNVDLLVRDGDDRPTGPVTRARLAAARAASSYTDRLRLRDVVDAAPAP
ncbi:hypothetical protein [Streptomyces sp. bgisy126]|uniref:hypothetical protein n=1 Tax=unclassified Streptomyces TaxID=2593676 RepID=UPI003EBF542B